MGIAKTDRSSGWSSLRLSSNLICVATNMSQAQRLLLYLAYLLNYICPANAARSSLPLASFIPVRSAALRNFRQIRFPLDLVGSFDFSEAINNQCGTPTRYIYIYPPHKIFDATQRYFAALYYQSCSLICPIRTGTDPQLSDKQQAYLLISLVSMAYSLAWFPGLMDSTSCSCRRGCLIETPGIPPEQRRVGARRHTLASRCVFCNTFLEERNYARHTFVRKKTT